MRWNWFNEHRRWILNASLAVATMLLLTLRYYSDDSVDNDLEGLYEDWSQDPQTGEESLQALAKTKLPARLSAQIVQKLILLDKGSEADSFLKDSLAHLRFQLPDYAAFSEDALRISKGDYQEAFESAARLKEKLIAEGRAESLLYGFNLFRLKGLTHALQSGEEEASLEFDDFCKSHRDVAKLLSP